MRAFFINLLPWLVITAWFFYTSNGKMFSSSITYAQNWYFFGYFHHILRDGFHLLQVAIFQVLEMIQAIGKALSISWLDVSWQLNWAHRHQLHPDLREAAKYLSLAILGMLQVCSFLLFFSQRLSFKLYLLVSVQILLLFFPTIHPWYLLLLLFFWLPYRSIFSSPVVWSALILCSKIFYAYPQEQYITRYCVYAVVTWFLIQDIHILTRNVRKKNFLTKP